MIKPKISSQFLDSKEKIFTMRYSLFGHGNRGWGCPVRPSRRASQVAEGENYRRLPSIQLPSVVAEISGTINRFNHLSSLSLSSGEISRADPAGFVMQLRRASTRTEKAGMPKPGENTRETLRDPEKPLKRRIPKRK